MKNRIWTKRISIALLIAIIGLMAISSMALAIGNINDMTGLASSNNISLWWDLADNSTSTVIRYSTTSFPATITSGTSGYSGSSYFTTITGLNPGTTYFISAWGSSVSGNSSTPKTLAITTLASLGENTTIPYTTPAIPASAWQNPDSTGWSWHPLDDILDYFSDPTYTHGGLGMPTDNLIMFIVGLIITGLALVTYVKWRSFLSSWFIAWVFVGLACMAHVMQWYVFGVMIIIGWGYWSVEHNFQ